MYRAVLEQAAPLVNGWSGFPRNRTSRPFSTVAKSPQVLGQSRVQVVGMVCFMGMIFVGSFKCPCTPHKMLGYATRS